MKDMKKKVEKILISSTMILTMAFTVMPTNLNAQENNITNSSREVEISIEPKNFPDDYFKTYVKNNIDKDNDNSLSQVEINAVTKIAFVDDNINSFKGIEYFTALTDLSIGKAASLTDIDLSKNTALTSLKIVQTKIENLDLSANTALKSLIFQSSLIKSLDLSSNIALTYLDCSWTQSLTSLNISKNTALEYLNLRNSQIKELNVSQNTALKELNCGRNQLTSLDVSKSTTLEKLECYGNQLTGLDVNKNTVLAYLDCGENQLPGLDVSKNTTLTGLYCSDNQLTSLDVSQNTALKELFCGSNQLTSLDVNQNTSLTSLDCETNQLTSLDVSQNTALKELNCGSNRLTSLDLSNNVEFDELNCSLQTRSISFSKNKGYLLSAYDAGFDKSKALDFKDATLEADGTLTGVTLNTPITYNYDTGYVDGSMDVTLTFIPATDSSKLEEAKPLAEKAITNIRITNDTTAKNILDAVTKSVSSVDGVTVLWKAGSPIITKATSDKEGSITGTIVLTSGSKTVEITVNKVINKLSSNATIVDKTTGTEIEYEDGSVFADDITLVVTPKSKEEMKEFQNNVNKVVTGKTIAGIYDIKLLKNGAEIQPDGKLKISLALTDEMKAMSELQVVYIDDNGKVTIIASQLVDGKLVFITDHFSYYGVIGKAATMEPTYPIVPTDPITPTKPNDTETVKPTSPQTGDTSNTMLSLGLILLSGCIAGYGLKKKKALRK